MGAEVSSHSIPARASCTSVPSFAAWLEIPTPASPPGIFDLKDDGEIGLGVPGTGAENAAGAGVSVNSGFLISYFANQPESPNCAEGA